MNKKILILSFLSVLFLAAGPIRAAIGVTNLRTEQLKNPSGIDTHQPRLGWRIESNEQNVMQTAYHILVASSPDLLAQGKGDMWDSGKVETDASQWITYQGENLKRNAPYFWKVKVYTNKGESDWSSPAFWSMDYSMKQTGKVSGSVWTVQLRGTVKLNGAAWQPVIFARNLP